MASVQLRRCSLPSLARSYRFLSVPYKENNAPLCFPFVAVRRQCRYVYRARADRPTDEDTVLNNWSSVVCKGQESNAQARQYLENLSENQRNAVVSDAKVTRVIAGPGSGKTRVLVAGAVHQIAKGANPSSLMLLTFTNKAAAEIKRRLTSVFQTTAQTKGIEVGTFHSVALRILRRHISELREERTNKFQIADEEETMCIILDNYLQEEAVKIRPDDSKEVREAKIEQTSALKKNLRVRSKEMKFLVADIKEIICTTKGLSGAEVMEEARDKIQRHIPSTFPRCFDQYQKKMAELNLFDFGDLVGCVVWLFRKYPNIRRAYQTRFQHVFVDEMQDTNAAQYEFLRLLTSETHPSNMNGVQLFTVGDPNQSIYQFRGANMMNMSKQMDKDFGKEMETVKLLENYRSQAAIVGFAEGMLLNHIPESMYVKLLPRRGAEFGNPVTLKKADSEEDEGMCVADAIHHMHVIEGVNYSNIAVLYRTHILSRTIEKKLFDKGIPYFVHGRSFWQKQEIKDAICYLRFICNPEDSLAFDRIYNKPPRGIGEKTLDTLKAWAMREGKKLSAMLVKDILDHVTDAEDVEHVEIPDLKLPEGPKLTKNAKSGLQNLRRIFVFLRNAAEKVTPAAVITALMDGCRFRKYLNPDPDKLLNKCVVAEQNVEALADVWNLQRSMNENSPPTGIETLTHFVQEASLYSDSDRRRAEDSVHLMTVHAAKGLEFDAVFVIGCEDGVFPSFQCLHDASAIQEEARLMFVAITRAKDRLMITWTPVRFIYGAKKYLQPSRFIRDTLHDSVVLERV